MDRKKTQYYKGVSSPKSYMDRVLFISLCVCEIFLAGSKMYLKEQRRLLFLCNVVRKDLSGGWLWGVRPSGQVEQGSEGTSWLGTFKGYAGLSVAGEDWMSSRNEVREGSQELDCMVLTDCGKSSRINSEMESH